LHLGQCVQGQQWRWDGVDFRFLSPEAGATDKKGNNLSCVLLVTVAGHRLLLTGDIEARVEAQLLLSAGAYFPDDVLLAPHHGSITSSSPAFVAAVKPKTIVFSTGYLNRYHFPEKSVQTRYKMQRGLEYNTAYSGAISFSFDEHGEMSSVNTVRQDIAWQESLEKLYTYFANQ
jgi:competence protein ComEC